jgi:uncharacterized protein
MTGYHFSLADQTLEALPSGALFWPAQGLLCVSDLHLGKSERLARRGGALLPPYETTDTLAKLESELAATRAMTVICLGDSFDDSAAVEALSDDNRLWLIRLMSGRQWIWIAGNHDPAPIGLGGSDSTAFSIGPLTFRHIADPAARNEVSGHYHPKFCLQLGRKTQGFPCFLLGQNRLILPAFGTYTGGHWCDDPAMRQLLTAPARAILTGHKAIPVPLSALQT